MWSSFGGWLLAVGCDRAREPTDRPPVETGAPPVPWPYAPPDLEASELVPGFVAALTLPGLPPGAVVTFLESREGLVASCPAARVVGLSDSGVEVGHDCALLLEPTTEFGSAVADAEGTATLLAEVPFDSAPDVVYFQARVEDPATGASTWSSVAQRHVAVPPSASSVALVDRAAGAGVATFTFGNSHTGGIAWPDYNGDLLPDLLVTNGGGENHRLYRNDGDGRFTDVSAEVRKPSTAYEDAAAHFADIDGDYDVDLLFVVDSAVPMDSEAVQPREGGPNLLFVNQGDGTFAEQAASRGLVDPRGWRNITGAFADFDGDGDVDVHLGTWAMNQPGSDRFGRLLWNDGSGQFTDSGLALGHGRDVLTSLAADLDIDGFPELYLGNVNRITGFVGSNPAADDVYYRNDAGTLVDATPAGVGDDAWAAMGLDVGDVDNDGDFDLYEADRWEVADPLPRGNPLYLNDGTGVLADNSCDVAGVCTGYAGWPTQFADFDRDGWVDLWVGSGKGFYVDLLYVNNHDGTFWSHALPSLVDNAVRGSATADYDADGDVDLALWNLGGVTRLYVNEPRDAHHWAEIKLVGATSNTEAIGAVVRLTSADGSQLRRVSGGDGAHSQSSSILHFGLGAAADPVSLEVVWPGGAHQLVHDVPIDRLARIGPSGLLPEELLSASATRATDGTLTVWVRTSQMARTSLSTTLGPLGWDPESLGFAGTFADAPDTAEIEIASGLGGVFVLPVSPVP